jgi:redox-sensitive bicupin YhaK (pirin superfamily)
MARARLIALLAAAGIAAGCSLFHHEETPQQRFLDALNRGHSAEASQIWLNMSPEDRNKFRLGQGLTPAVPPQKVVKMLSQQGVTGGEGQITIGPHTGASLTDLPAAAARSVPPSLPAPPESGD